ncbi:amino acid adenylation domain-containing protein [Pseudomonas sp. FP2294]|uniref:amino acid adenylation domain-containing protein n=1 Tax=Pseudomonas sp. FP2294 TaxID=2954089 RepID=UPI00351EA747
MQANALNDLIDRFIKLPVTQRKTLYEQMSAKGMSLSRLPIPQTRHFFAQIPLSFAQERQWFLWLLDPASAAYNLPTALRLRGPLDVDALQRSFDTLIERHQSLRTRFVEEPQGVIQVIDPLSGLFLDVISKNGATDSFIKDFVEQQSRQPFDLRRDQLLRVKLLRISEEDHVLLLVQHHIVSDDWSMHMMVQELVQLYGGYSQGLSVELQALPIQYTDYSIWQRRWMEAGESERQLAYWKGQLGGEQPVLELPTDRSRPAVQSYRGANITVTVPPALAQKLKQLAQQSNVTLFMLLLASFQALLHHYSRQADIRVGVPVANRNRVETERLLGFFVNTQVLRARFDEPLSFSELLAQVKQTALQAQAHQDLPFEQLVEALQPERNLSLNPLFQVMFNHLSEHQGASAGQPSSPSALHVESLSREHHTAQFDLTLNTFESAQGLSATLNYATDLFDASTIERFGKHWLNLLEHCIAAPQQPINSMSLLSDMERQQILRGWNASTADYPRDSAIHHLIEAQAARTPDAVALVFHTQSLTFARLNQQANRLAHRLIAAGVGPDVLVGIAVRRSVDLVVGLLAILKAGGAYVPLDPAYPEERLAYMMQDSGLALLLTQAPLLARLPIPAGVSALALDQPDAWLDGYSCENPLPRTTAEHLAYVIYTSGSTGKPKGVMVRHGALTNFVCSMARQPGLDANDRLLSLTTFSFDIFGLEIYGPLLAGATLVLTGQDINLDPQALLALVKQQRISVLQATPSTWRMLLDHPQADELKGCKLLCGGEALPLELATRLLALSPQVWNLYGPTETTIWSAQYPLTPTQPQPWLGGPIANTSLYILDDNLAPVPVGVAGELLIGGDGLARGYFQRPALTAERFLPDPFGAPGTRLYRTGDLARYRADGVIEYIGRVDHQVKIRGLRIELGEIEARLLEQPQVREAAVVVRDVAGHSQLVAYVVAVQAVSDEQALREACKRQLKGDLPEYMVPIHWVFLASLPLTPNGKLDRKVLPAPDASLAQKTYVAPCSPLQQQVAAIWQDVLKVEPIGLEDHFFELGGHSLLVVSVVSRLQLELGMQLTPQLMFQHPTLGAFTAQLEQQAGPVTAQKLDKLEALLDEMEEF